MAVESDLVDMGFPASRVQVAMQACGDNLEAVLQWLIDHGDEEAAGDGGSSSATETELLSMGFEREKASAAVRACGEDLEKALVWLVDGASRCEAEPAADEWSCSTCYQTAEELEAAGQQILWLPCAHRACVRCHRHWIESQDEQGRPPTCMACKAEAADDSAVQPLDDASIRALLGAEAHAARADRLMDRAGLWSCPTPDCSYMVALEEGLTARSTTCPRCHKVVVVGEDASKGGAPSAAAGSRGAAPSASAAPRAPAGTGSEADPLRWNDSEEDETSTSSEEDDEPLAERNRKRVRDEASAAEEAKRRRDDQASAEALQNVRTCPGCKRGVEKTPESCDKFQCLCGTRFCWRCGTLADAAGNAMCRCTGRDHVFWDNVRNRPDGRKRVQRPARGSE